MLKFNECKLNDKILDQWIKADVNVLLIGEKGVGKSAQIINAFNRNNLKYAYFSGATLDPWIHLLGIPKAKIQEDGSEKMEFILPENLDNDVQAIFCDEWNRTNKVVRNALLELQQFKSINGRKFPNLKIVWGAVNPPKNESDDNSMDYDVDELDPAQLDRFHIIVELPNEPEIRFFKSRFGEYQGRVLVDWWTVQSIESKKILSPRRLEYIGESFNKGLDIKYLLPVSANHAALIKKLSSDEDEEKVQQMFKNNKSDELIEFVKSDDNFLKYKGALRNPKYWKYWKYAKPEFVIDEMKSNENFANFALYRICKNSKFYKDQLIEISKADPSNHLLKIVKILKLQKYNPPNESSISELVGDNVKFPVIPILDASDVDTFSNQLIKGDLTTVESFRPEYYGSGTPMTYTDRIAMLTQLLKCIYNTSTDSAISFIFGCLQTMGAANAKTYKFFIPLIGTACILAKNRYSKVDLLKIAEIIKNNRAKLSMNRIEDFNEYLLGKEKMLIDGVPEGFLQKIREVRDMIINSSEEKV